MEAPPPDKKKPAGVTFILENANLEAAKVGFLLSPAFLSWPDGCRLPSALAPRPELAAPSRRLLPGSRLSRVCV